MRLAVETLAAVNLCMDMLSVSAACRLCSPARIRPVRVLCASAVGTAYAFVQQFWPLRGGWAAIAFAAAAYVMATIAIPANSARERLRCSVVLLACQLLAGGACMALQRLLKGAFAALLCGGCAVWGCVAAIRQAQRRAAGTTAVITCVFDGRKARMHALIDTGNRLCDPITGLPVIAAPREALDALALPELDPADPSTLPPGFRLLRAQTAAGPCLLMCFHPQQLMIEYEGRCVSTRALIALSAASEGAMALMPSQMLAGLEAEHEKVTGKKRGGRKQLFG